MEMAFEQHCVVELFGHQKIAGRCSEYEIAGQQFLRVQVPKTTRRDGFTKFYGPSAIYALTPVEEDIAQSMAEALNEAPIQEWRIANVELLPAAGDDDDDFDDDYDDVVLDDDPDENDDEDSMLTRGQEDRCRAINWARSLLESSFVIFDTETTGTEADDEIIQIGVIDQDGIVLLDQLIKPDRPIENAYLHHITDEMVADAPAFPKAYPYILAVLEGKNLVAWNYDFDGRMLDQEVAKHDLEVITRGQADCAMQWFANFYGEWDDRHANYRWKGLPRAMEYFGLEYDGQQHNAVADCKAALAVIKVMAQAELPVQNGAFTEEALLDDE